jgi:hypothetical protein
MFNLSPTSKWSHSSYIVTIPIKQKEAKGMPRAIKMPYMLKISSFTYRTRKKNLKNNDNWTAFLKLYYTLTTALSVPKDH